VIVKLIFRALIDPVVNPILSERYGADHTAILDQIWTGAAERWATLSRQSTLGAAITVRLAAVTAAAYETLAARHTPAEDATQIVYDIAWAIYQRMGRAAWIASGALSTDTPERLRLATIAFRIFPFSAPSYEWQPVPSPTGVVSFDCLRCPVAEYFKEQDLSELCVRTWCALDFPLAANVWNARLERAGSIAGGASRCDFRWHAETSVGKINAPN
jgi:ubiquinone biosynthesis protein